MVLGSPIWDSDGWDGSFHWTGLANATWYLLEVFGAMAFAGALGVVQLPRGGELGRRTDCAVATAGLNLVNRTAGGIPGLRSVWLWHLHTLQDLHPECCRYRLTTVVNPTGSGVINAPGQNCPGGYRAGTIVQLTAVPEAGCRPRDWSGDAGGASNPVR